jgi:hypothetical protein
MREYPLVRIEWNDAVNGNGWLSRHDLKNHHAIPCVTEGRLISKTRNEYKLTGTVAADGDFIGYQIIPIGMVKSIKVIEQKEIGRKPKG